MKTHVTSVDNARERVAPDGTIIGLDSLRKRPGKIELLLLAAASGDPAALVFIEATKFALRELEHSPEVDFPAGTDIALAVDEFQSPKVLPDADTPDLTATQRMDSLFSSLPERTRALHPDVASDWINIGFLGSKETLERAFSGAGWQTSDQLSLRSEVRTFLAIAEQHAYKDAPVSTLLVAGRAPDLIYQKQTNTFAKRHHIRIWSTDKTLDGETVWIAAATHDIGIDFSGTAKTFTHQIDPEVDLERTKVITDLTFAGRVAAVAFVARPLVPATSRNATGDQIRTDGRLAVVTIAP